ncbi:Nif3-like dinuclear metal center hexameric protein [Bacillus sp. 2205SS5-2]|uniref:Nif3-like dinuclear metal center hexameric protein n=1 Tax=Bacillus sp. 2205SS5-2 TaxID=3109031 RepID=UPI00300556E0
MKKVNGFQIIEQFEDFSPKKYALEGDKIGLQVGSLNKNVERVMITLDVLEEVVDEAIEKQIDLIIAHHPPIYNALKNLVTDKGQGRIFEKLIKNDIAVYVAHTNLDVAQGGVNDLLAEALLLENTNILVPSFEEDLSKLVVYVPEEAADEVRKALGESGAGHIGNYQNCSFSSSGTGRFLPLKESNPYIGSQGKAEEVTEVRIETIVEQSLEQKLIKTMLKAHPYEEPAYDVIKLKQKGRTLGLGRIGSLKEPMSLEAFAQFVKKQLKVEGVRFVGHKKETVKKVAVLGGDGNKYIHAAKFKGADVLVTGDLYFHTAHEAMMLGLNVVDPGHHVEKVMIKGVAKILERKMIERNFKVEIIQSETNTNPFTIV